MIIQLFSSFSKKENSTKKPSGTVDKSVTGVLKEPCSLSNPVFKIERFTPDVSPANYTYAIIPTFHRFYFVEDWIWADGLWECHMSIDVLATYRDIIGASSEYVLRTDSTTNFNGEITDTMYPATTDFSMHEYYAPSVFSSDLTAGCYIVGIISGGQTDAVGAITYYAMTSSEFGALKEMLFSNDNLQIMGIIDSQGQQIVQDLSQEVLKTLYNPYQYIASCMWFPFPKTAITSKTDVNALKIGWWGYPLSGSRLYAQIIEFGENLPIQAHPQSASRGSYLNYAPYTRRTLIGRFGTVALDTAYFTSSDQISIGYSVDLITGQCRATIEKTYTTSGTLHHDVLAERRFLLAVPIQIAQVGTDYLGTVVNAVGTVGSALGGAVSGLFSGGIGGAVMGAISNSANGIYNTIQSAMPQVETSGSNGSFLSPSTHTALLEHYYQIVDEDIGHKGRPLCEIRQLNTLSGFILCAEGDLDINGFDNERKLINKYLTTGFFWE